MTHPLNMTPVNATPAMPPIRASDGEAILLVGHGTKDEQGVQEFLDFARALERRQGQFVQAAFLEFNEPAIPAAVSRCIEAGASRIAVIPLFLGAATHQKNDVPTAVNVLRRRFARVEFAYGSPLGAHASIASALATRIEQSIDARHAAGAPIVDHADTAILLVGRGSRDPDSNSELYKVGRLLYEGRQYGMVESCFIAISLPDLPAGIDRCVRLGARRIVVTPHMLFTGVLSRRMERTALEAGTQHSDIEIAVAAPLGAEEHLLQVVSQRIDEARTGSAHSNCDSCKYRVRMPGFESEFALPQGSDHNHGLRGFAERLEPQPHSHGHAAAVHDHA